MHHHLRRARPWALVLVLLALLASACGSDGEGASAGAADPATDSTQASEPVDLSTVTLRVGDVGGAFKAGLEVAGELDDLPYAVDWSEFPVGPPAIEAINAGALDLSVMGDTPPIFALAGGVDVKLVGAARLRNPDLPYLQLLVAKGSDIQSVADLKGRKVAVSRQTIFHYFLLRALDDAGLTLDDVDAAFLDPTEASGAFQSGDVEALVSIEPLTTILGGTEKTRSIAESIDLLTSQSVAVARGKALDDPALSAAIGDFLARTARAYDWQYEHPDEYIAAYQAATEYPAQIASTIVKSTSTKWLPIDDDVIDVQQQQLDTFAQAGLVPEGLDAAEQFDDRFNDQIQEASP